MLITAITISSLKWLKKTVSIESFNILVTLAKLEKRECRCKLHPRAGNVVAGRTTCLGDSYELTASYGSVPLDFLDRFSAPLLPNTHIPIFANSFAKASTEIHPFKAL